MIRKIGTKNMAVILLIGAMVLAGNLAHAQTSMDPQWTELSPTGGLPSPRAGSAAVFDSATDQMFIFGGGQGTAQNNDVWALSLGSNPQWTQVSTSGTPPAPRQLSAGVYDEKNSRLILFGGGLGSTSPCQNDTWVLTDANGASGVPTWAQLATSGGPPSPRYAPGVYDPTSNTLIIFGGDNCFATFYNDVWTLSSANGLGGTPTWTQMTPGGTPPSPRSLATAVYDSASNTLIVFGGNNGPTSFNEVWTLSNANGMSGTPTWTQLNPTGPLPAARSYHTAIYDPTTDVMTIFGGVEIGGTLLNDVWTLSNANGNGGSPTWSQVVPSGTITPPRAAHTAIFDSDSGNMVVFGGTIGEPSTGESYNDETWVLMAEHDTTPPVITISASPTTLWPPNGKVVPVTVSGKIADTEAGGSGVNTSTAAYTVVDEYGVVQPSGSITLGVDGSYSFTVLLEASRRGDDLDGRHYTVTVSAQDNAGNPNSAKTVVTVPHDQRH